MISSPTAHSKCSMSQEKVNHSKSMVHNTQVTKVMYIMSKIVHAIIETSWVTVIPDNFLSDIFNYSWLVLLL
ncbi:MAG: hypothetical protein Ct9H300mP9_8210 [Candidatus Neomarinimicrobiota bacterium]|nr:MAG: hypothetical protein Ct9H300mP9_8210 [Candidatus Neomarinimicrobiota bacterium]